MGLIPERWVDYAPINKPIENVPIVAFKTPLSERYNRSSRIEDDGVFVEEDEEFTPEQLCKKIEDLGYELAVIIDLTFTFRYYNGHTFGDRGIQYEKVKCEGQKVPSDRVFGRIADIINDVIYENGKDSKKIVGIHCTHGVNRTGYLVCRYMIDYLGFEPEDAIKAFNTSRGYDIEREHYLEDLKARKPQQLYDEWKVKRAQREKDGFESWNENIRSFERDEPYRYHLPNAGGYRRHYDERRYYNRQNNRHFRGRFYNRRKLNDKHSYRKDPWNERNLNKNGVQANEDQSLFACDEMVDGSGFVVESFNTEQLASINDSQKENSTHPVENGST